ncbi:MAG TPA: long-chain fatty acid--CoA ligase [Candidatus Limnocylindrales bacterium]|nr:long-chain fatty acid--CoA ligase [Candidatus Limnocylindrales bacterium]
MNVGAIFEKWVQEQPDKPALIFEGREISYLQLEDWTNQVANGLVNFGLKKGDTVAIDLPSSPELVISYLGSMKAGMVANVINVLLKADEISYILKDATAKVMVTHPDNIPTLHQIQDHLPALEQVLITGTSETQGFLAFDTWLSKNSKEFKPLDCDRGDVANLLYTSGTTGFPKGVMLTHLNIWDNAENFAKIHYQPDDRLMVAAPLFHCWGLINGVLAMLYAGGTVVIEPRFITEKVLADIEKYRPTIFQGVPTMYNYLCKSPDMKKRDISSLRFVLSAAAPMPVELIRTLKEEYHIEYAEAYGLTEVSPVITTAPYTKTRPGSCGYAMGDTEFRVVNEKGEDVPLGEPGELLCRGTAVMKGYLNKPEATRAVIDEEGWFHTGDIVTMDKDGYVYIVDRTKDMINFGGFKVYPREVEEVLHKHPKVRDAAVVGIKDEVKGELVKAFIVPKEGEKLSPEEIIQFCRERIASYKIPRVVEFVDQIPRSASGKTLRRILREKK